jgi:hypothetical protein
VLFKIYTKVNTGIASLLSYRVLSHHSCIAPGATPHRVSTATSRAGLWCIVVNHYKIPINLIPLPSYNFTKRAHKIHWAIALFTVVIVVVVFAVFLAPGVVCVTTRRHAPRRGATCISITGGPTSTLICAAERQHQYKRSVPHHQYKRSVAAERVGPFGLFAGCWQKWGLCWLYYASRMLYYAKHYAILC